MNGAVWGIAREKIRPGVRLLQGPDGARAYVVEAVDEKFFTMRNIETGLAVREAFTWLECYREIEPPAPHPYVGED